RWRGAAPVQHALIAGDEPLGVSVFQLVPELDAGDVYAARSVALPEDATAGTALELLAHDGADLVGEVVGAIADGTARARPQRGDVTLAPKLVLADGALDWSLPAEQVL